MADNTRKGDGEMRPVIATSMKNDDSGEKSKQLCKQLASSEGEAVNSVTSRSMKWMDDRETDVCLDCGSMFGYINRKHHCRCCLRIFCSSCLVSMVIPDYIEGAKPKLDRWIKSDGEYVCKQRCEEYIKTQIDISRIRELMVIEPPSIAGVISRYGHHPRVIDYYFGLLSDIQYCYPNHKFHDYQKRLLKNNWGELSGHSRYVCQVIKSLSWRDAKLRPLITTIVLNMIDSRPKRCSHVRCVAHCETRGTLLSSDDVMDVLSSGVASSLPGEVLDYLFNILREDRSLHAYLPVLVRLVYLWNPSDILLEKLSTLFVSTGLMVQAYWFLRAAQEGAKDNIPLVKEIQKFISGWDKGEVRDIEADRLFFVSVAKAGSEREVMKILAMQSWPVRLPYSSDIKIVGYDSVKEIDSGSLPIKVVFRVEGKLNNPSQDRVSILFKKSKVMKDLVCMNIISIWLDAIREDFPEVSTVLYPVMPIGPDCGMCQFVDDCCDISGIIAKQLDLTQWFNAKIMSLNVPPKTILGNYRNTLIMLTLSAHFLYIGDRHYENILITNNGEIFHIDFDYIMGDKPRVSSARSGIRLTSFMLKPVKHEENYMYNQFVEMIGPCAVKIHQRINSTFALLSVIADDDTVANFMSDRFFIRSSPMDIDLSMRKIVENSIDDEDVWLSGDTVHRIIKDKSIQKGVTAAVGSVGSVLVSAFKWLNPPQ
jgi:hypothetical protein